jgi:hypothetical protein
MKKTSRNQNMPDQQLRNNESANTASLNNENNLTGRPERYSDPNLNQPLRNTKQHYDDTTGTVENKIDNR